MIKMFETFGETINILSRSIEAPFHLLEERVNDVSELRKDTDSAIDRMYGPQHTEATAAIIDFANVKTQATEKTPTTPEVVASPSHLPLETEERDNILDIDLHRKYVSDVFDNAA